jgi:thymidylate kinase
MTVRTPPASERTLPLVRDLCVALDRASVDYCHWKSNAFLNRSRTGENDLDLLVRRSDGDRFVAVLNDLRFKAAESPKRALPGVSHFYGYDKTCSRLLHVHAHFQLILGDDLTKGYRIPLEDALLDGAIEDEEFRIAPPELELIVLVIRLALKHSTAWAVITREATPPKSAMEEVRFLRSRADEDLVNGLLERYLPFVGRSSFNEHLRSLDQDEPAPRRIRSGRRLVRDLSPCARRSKAADVGLKLWRRASSLVARATRRGPTRKRLVAGGALIAVVGADGAGKSTLVDGLSTWLSRNFSVQIVHLGRPAPSLITRAVRVMGLARSGVSSAWRKRSAGGRPRDDSSVSRVRLLNQVALARDRYRTYRAAARAATNGAIVIADRFPLPQLTAMDAPRVRPAPGPGAPSRFLSFLAALERRYYDAISQPDVLIVLRVDPDVAVARKPEESAEFVRARWQEIWEIDWEATHAHVVDAGGSETDVLTKVKDIIWSQV